MSHHSVLVCFPHCCLCARSVSPWLLSLGVPITTSRCRHVRYAFLPELCDDHTPPLRLVTNSLVEPRYRSVNTLVLPDPLLTQGGPVTFPACALHYLFVCSCDLAHHGLCCSHVCAHSSLLNSVLGEHLECFDVPRGFREARCPFPALHFLAFEIGSSVVRSCACSFCRSHGHH